MKVNVLPPKKIIPPPPYKYKSSIGAVTRLYRFGLLNFKKGGKEFRIYSIIKRISTELINKEAMKDCEKVDYRGATASWNNLPFITIDLDTNGKTA